MISVLAPRTPRLVGGPQDVPDRAWSIDRDDPALRVVTQHIVRGAAAEIADVKPLPALMTPRRQLGLVGASPAVGAQVDVPSSGVDIVAEPVHDAVVVEVAKVQILALVVAERVRGEQLGAPEYGVASFSLVVPVEQGASYDLAPPRICGASLG